MILGGLVSQCLPLSSEDTRMLCVDSFQCLKLVTSSEGSTSITCSCKMWLCQSCVLASALSFQFHGIFPRPGVYFGAC